MTPPQAAPRGGCLEENVSDTLARVSRIRATLEARGLGDRSIRRRGLLWQQARREAEARARRSAAELHRFLVLEGGAASRFATRIGLSPRTVRRWAARYEGEARIWTPRGRGVERSVPEVRNRVVRALEVLGSEVSGRRLAGLFDDMPRGEVADIEARYRKWHARRHPRLVGVLSWTRPGAVWAMDHAFPPEPVDGAYPAIFALRDLASGYQILWEPLEDEGAERVVSWLQRCFERWGAPLVLKSDSGPAFIAEVLESFLRERGVKHILSPPRRPQYNGSIEASIRWMKVRTEREAHAAGRSGSWRREDMQRARLGANTAERRRKGVALDLWLPRSPIGEELRSSFHSTVASEELSALADRGLPARAPLPVLLRRAVQRDAIRRALVAHDLLRFKRRSLPQPVKPMIADNCA